MKLLCTSFLLAISLLSSFVQPNSFLQPNEIEFRNVTVVNNFPEGIVFRIEICGREAATSVIFHYQIAGDWGWSEQTWTTDEGQTSDGCDKRKYSLRTQPLDIPPFAPVRYYWSVVEGFQVIGKSSTYRYPYQDTRYTWKTIEDEDLVIFWHDRPDSFGEDVKFIAAHAYDDQARFYSFKLEQPITIVISNTSEEFFSWQDELDETAGLSFPDMSLTIQLVEDTQDYYYWLSDVLPHEISHVYFNHLVKRYSGASHWLDEGLATYSEYGDHWYEWDILKTAHQTDELLSLKDLEYDFGEDPQKIDLAYAESYYAVLYMDEVYGKDAIPTLLYEFSKGSSAKAAFQKTFNKSPEEFESHFIAWLDDGLKNPPPAVEIPQRPQISTNVENDLEKSPSPLPYLALLCLFVMGLGVVLLPVLYFSLILIRKRKSTGLQG